MVGGLVEYHHVTTADRENEMNWKSYLHIHVQLIRPAPITSGVTLTYALGQD